MLLFQSDEEASSSGEGFFMLCDMFWIWKNVQFEQPLVSQI